jgi:hypothetical protein
MALTEEKSSAHKIDTDIVLGFNMRDYTTPVSP